MSMKHLLKKWLIRKLIKIAIDTKQPIQTELFDWIYSSPIHTWRDKLLIVRACDDFTKEYYRWLSNETTFSTGDTDSITSPETR